MNCSTPKRVLILGVFGTILRFMRPCLRNKPLQKRQKQRQIDANFYTKMTLLN